MSPFKGKVLLSIDFGRSFVGTPKGDFENLLRQIIANTHGMKTYDGDKYLLILPEIDYEQTEVVWISCYGQKGPRKTKKD